MACARVCARDYFHHCTHRSKLGTGFVARVRPLGGFAGCFGYPVPLYQNNDHDAHGNDHYDSSRIHIVHVSTHLKKHRCGQPQRGY